MEISPPITSARSVRRSSATVGNNTCVTRHKPHRDRRGRTSSRRPRPRSARRRANPHGRKQPPPQMTQPYLPAASLASTRAASASTLITRATPRTSDGPLALRTRKGGGSVRVRTLNTLSAPAPPPQPDHHHPTAAIRTDDASGASALRTSGAQQELLLAPPACFLRRVGGLSRLPVQRP